MRISNNNVEDLKGQRFGKLVVDCYAGSSRGALWACICDCGKTTVAKGNNLRSGNTTSCGCVKRASIASVNFSHGKTGTPEYRIWNGIIDRCCNPNCPAYPDYGGRGITICNEWRHDFAAFLAYVGTRPSSKHTIDRINNDLGYAPGNVRWATKIVQARNTRANRFITYGSRTLTLAEWAEITGIGHSTIANRLKSGWSVDDALTKPARAMRGASCV